MSTAKDVTIIGAGPVGLFGAFYGGLRGMSVRIVDSLEEAGGQLTALYPEKFIYDMPGFPEVVAKDLARNMVLQASRFNPELSLGEQCIKLSRDGGHWHLETTKGVHVSKTVVICAGVGSFSPTRLGVEGEERYEGRGLTYGVQDKQALRGKRCIVVGGGDSALDWSLALCGYASHVTLIHRRDQFRGHEQTAKMVYDAGAEVRLWETVERLHGDERLSQVTVRNKQTGQTAVLDCDALIVCIGYKTTLGPLKEWGLNLQGNKIVVNARQETNLPGVYAAGDICTHEAKLDLIATGVGEVCVAVNYAKVHIDPSAKAFPGHSTDMELPSLPK